MKNVIIWSFALILLLGSTSCNAQGAKKEETKAIAKGKVEVIYFHFTRRCMTCNAVESETKNVLETLYATQIKAGKIAFKSINLDEPTSKTAAEKYAAEGQSLLIIGSGKRIDMTSQGFMYAVNNPERLKAELKKTIDPLL